MQLVVYYASTFQVRQVSVYAFALARVFASPVTLAVSSVLIAVAILLMFV